MTDADELARRYFSLWAEYLTALVADPQAAELLQRWIAFTSQFANGASERPGNPFGNPFPAWPPLAAGFAAAGPKAAAAPAAGASGERGDAVGELARRVGELERRLADLEHKGERRPASRRPRRGNRASGE